MGHLSAGLLCLDLDLEKSLLRGAFFQAAENGSLLQALEASRGPEDPASQSEEEEDDLRGQLQGMLIQAAKNGNLHHAMGLDDGAVASSSSQDGSLQKAIQARASISSGED